MYLLPIGSSFDLIVGKKNNEKTDPDNMGSGRFDYAGSRQQP
jgi:hypothetical protein